MRNLLAAFCWLAGHNCVGINAPIGWSEQTCKTCRRRVRVHVRGEESQNASE